MLTLLLFILLVWTACSNYARGQEIIMLKDTKLALEKENDKLWMEKREDK